MLLSLSSVDVYVKRQAHTTACMLVFRQAPSTHVASLYSVFFVAYKKADLQMYTVVMKIQYKSSYVHFQLPHFEQCHL